MRYKVAIMLFKSASDGETIGGETMSLRRKKTVACPKCNKESDYLFWESLNGDLDPEAKTQLIDGTFFQFKCPYCGHECKVDYGMLYHDMAHQTMIYAGHSNAIFSEDALKVIHSFSSGIPRLINRACTQSLVYAYQNRRPIVDDRMVQLVLVGEVS